MLRIGQFLWVRQLYRAVHRLVTGCHHQNAISPRELYEYYLYTIERCNHHLLDTDDENIECELFEEFEGAYTFLHRDNLVTLRDAGFMDDAIVDLSVIVRKKWIAASRRLERTASFVRTSREWRDLFGLCERLVKMNTDRSGNRGG